MDRDQLSRRLLETFTGELDEQVRSLNRDLLALDKGLPAQERGERLASVFRSFHSLKGAARSAGMTVIESACHALESLLVKLRDGALELTPVQIQLLLDAVDALHEVAGLLREGRDLKHSRLDRLGARLAQPETPSGAAGPPVAPAPAPAPEVIRQERPETVVPLPAQTIVPTGSTQPRPAGESSLRVAAERLDALLARTGELRVARSLAREAETDLPALEEGVRRWRAAWVTAELKVARHLPAHLADLVRGLGEGIGTLDRGLDDLAGKLARDRKTIDQAGRQLDETARQIRLAPFAAACDGFDRVVRDLGHTNGKTVELVVEGADVELDRVVLDGLRAPLLHLVRNAVIHGIEAPPERERAGKPPRGRIVLTARLAGERVQVVVADDGRGLDMAALRDQARERGLPEPRTAEDFAALAFRPGLSTSPGVTALSGRGVGLDVVRNQAASLHGTAELTWTPDRGTSVVLDVPLSISTVWALLVKAGGQTFGLVGSQVARLLRVAPEELGSVEGRQVVLFDGQPLPVLGLAQTLGIEQPEPRMRGGKAAVAVLTAGRRRAAVVVDDLIAAREIVVESLGPRLSRIRNVAGVTVLPDGRQALVLNTADLVDEALAGTPVMALPPRAAAPARRRLLLVEDSVTTRTLEKSILEAAGYDVLAAADGAQAWQMLQDAQVDLVVADVDMPRMDGFALTEAIRGSRRMSRLPVVLVTALESDPDRARGLAAGANAYLSKRAFDQQRLLAVVAQLV